jgi:transposase
LAFKGALNGDLFKAYIKDCLAPTLKKGDIVIMDNLSSHKVQGVTDPIFEAGATVLYLPPYSPDFNPIELLWSKLKAFLKKVKVRSSDKLFDGIADALDTISLSDISNWFAHNNYSLR